MKFVTIPWDETEIQMLRNAHQGTSLLLKNYIDQVLNRAINYYNGALTTAYNRVTTLKTKVICLRGELTRLPGENITSKTKVPEPPTFAGSENKMYLYDWLSQITLYCSASSIISDDQKIISALTCLRAPASTYMKSYYDKVQAGLSVGSWNNFAQELKNIYKQRDDKEGAKKELTALWVNKDLARKNFVKYAERYRTLARIVNYSNEVHIDKMKKVIPDELRNALVIYKITNQSPKTWDDYLKLLMQAYKALYLNKTQDTIFGPKAIGEKSRGKKDLDAMEIDEIQRKEGKSLQYCQIYTRKGFKNKSKMHNTVDCYNKPGNENKYPYKTSFQKLSPPGPSKNKNQSFRAWLMKMLEEDSDNPDSPPEDVKINSASIEEIPDPVPPSRKGKGTPKLDFPLGL